MSRIAYVDGRYLPFRESKVHIEDRGFQFADGIYEVCEIRAGRLVDEDRHLARMIRSLRELDMRAPMAELPLRVVLREVVRRNRINDGLLYLQITRGAYARAHAYPPVSVQPTLVVTARRSDGSAKRKGETGIAVITVPETRWARVDIKTVSLLPNAIAREAAKRAGATEAWFVDPGGNVNEGAASNAWIVTRDGELITAPTSAPILEGVTRQAVLEVVARRNLKLVERRFTVKEARDAAEAFVTSATALVTPVIRLDGAKIADGAPGPTTRALRVALHDSTVLAPLTVAPVARPDSFR
jgi:D-alanine transaminase